ncbi:MAG: HRDC domain-containing protein [Alphaproteobacteria bacterium]|nr:HRDC domain-containing protein [Alphaproteobacteria bacterium]
MADPDVRHVDAGCVAQAAASIAAASQVAVDTEFHAEGRYLPRLFLVQIAIPGGPVWIVDALQPELWPSLAPALRSTPWVVHAGEQDLRLLAPVLGGLPEVVHDTQIAAGVVSEHYPAPLAALCRTWLGVEVSKAARMSDWSQRPLDAAQVRYAAADAALLPALWDALSARAETLDRRAIVDLACAEAKHDALTDDPEAWRYAARDVDLSPREAAALRGLVAWRLQRARTEDRPPSFVLGDATLRQIARALPVTRADLAQNRRLSSRTVDRHGSAVVAAVQAALALPDDALPSVTATGSSASRQVDWLLLLARVDGHARSYAARLVVPWRTADAIVRATGDGDRSVPPLRDRIARSLGPWRAALVGDTVVAGLSGGSALGVVDDDIGAVPIVHNMRKSRST